MSICLYYGISLARGCLGFCGLTIFTALRADRVRRLSLKAAAVLRCIQGGKESPQLPSHDQKAVVKISEFTARAELDGARDRNKRLQDELDAIREDREKLRREVDRLQSKALCQMWHKPSPRPETDDLDSSDLNSNNPSLDDLGLRDPSNLNQGTLRQVPQSPSRFVHKVYTH